MCRLNKYYHTDQKYDKYDRLKSMLGLRCRFSTLDLTPRNGVPALGPAVTICYARIVAVPILGTPTL